MKKEKEKLAKKIEYYTNYRKKTYKRYEICVRIGSEEQKFLESKRPVAAYIQNLIKKEMKK